VGRSLKHRQQRIACGIAAAGLLILVGPPLLVTVGTAFNEPADVWQSLLRPRTLTLLGNSLAIASATTALSLAVGVPLGAILGRTRLPLTALALFLHALPLTLPPFISALAAFHLFGRGGWLGFADAPTWLFAKAGCVLVLTVCLAPAISVLTWLAVRGTDAAGDEAGRIVAGSWRTLWRVVLPQAAPAIVLGAIIVFSLALVDVAVPMFFRVDVYSAAIFTRLGGFAFAPGEAAALTVPLVACSLVLLILERLSPAHRVVALPSLRAAGPLLASRGAKTIATMTAVIAAAIGVTPIAVMSAVAARGDGFSRVADYLGDSVVNSITYAAGASTIVVLLAVIAVSVAREYPRLAVVQDALAWLAFLLPPALFSLGAIGFWNQASTQWIYSGPAVVILALAARYAVLAFRVESSGLTQLSPSLDETARVVGATYLQRLLRVHLPSLRPYTTGAWLLVFVFCLRDMETVALLYPAGGEPLTVRLFTLEANGPPPVVAALAVVLTLMTLVPLAAASLALRRRQ
jgi:iron(III) transport system permease protein